MAAVRVAIIGAGAAGLCCARHLCQHQDNFSVRVFEKASLVGGTWVYTDETEEDTSVGLPVHSSMYASLRLGFTCIYYSAALLLHKLQISLTTTFKHSKQLRCNIHLM